jgi:DNA-binding NtrC family response regulator
VSEESTPSKILIIEDEALIAREIQHRLTNMGWDVVGHAFGEEAIELAIKTQPDLLLSDIHLRHGLSGIDLAQRIQQVVDVPVVFLTAYSDEDTVAKAKAVSPFGYIIKPVENRDLQITIEMALYKFRVEKELKEKQQLLETALACIGNALIFLNESGEITNINADAATLIEAGVTTGMGWRSALGESKSVGRAVDIALTQQSLTKLPPYLLHRAGQATKLVDGIVGPMDEGAIVILRDLGDIEDPVRVGADERYANLGAEHLSPSESAFCQLLISPDDVEPEELMNVVEQVRGQLDISLRATDLASVFAHSLVSISLPYTDVKEGEKIAGALLEQLDHYRFQGQSLSFSAGLAFSAGVDQEPIELFRRATSALDTARRSGGGRLWVDSGDHGLESREIQGDKDYRHVVLLWNVMNALSAATDLDVMCDEFCRHLFHVFRANRAALLAVEDGRIDLDVGYLKDSGRTRKISDLQLSQSEFAGIKGVAAGTVRGQLLSKTALFAVADRWVLLLAGSSFSDDDHVFLETLNTYFASSIARFDVVSEPVATVDGSDQALIYESTEMQQVLDTADLAAPTDATVLVTGESGTGKELVARYIHEHGNRSNKPLVVVDCGAVSASLIESELFGHVKGAFTGATANFNGRLKEADGGTVLLDEVGELPLDTQVKFLRFVQERQVAAVGSNQYETVDARVIAATNKDLKEMVDAGTFREDLYYRLNVFSISVPPLRDRHSDVLKVAGHYLEHFSSRYNKQVTGFTEAAEQALQAYKWPGNVRELSNVVNRAVILSKDRLITAIQLGLFNTSEPEVMVPAIQNNLQGILSAMVDIGVKSEAPIAIGRMVEEDFVLQSVSHHAGVLNRAALAIGVPESTLRRKIQKIEDQNGREAPSRPTGWPTTVDLYQELMKQAANDEIPPLNLMSNLLFDTVEERNLSKTQSAQLLGVSLPTYRRLAEGSASIF